MQRAQRGVAEVLTSLITRGCQAHLQPKLLLGEVVSLRNCHSFPPDDVAF